MSKFVKSVAAAAVLATSATGTHAASLSTDVDVSLPSIIALFCYDSVTVNVDANGLNAALGAAPTGGLGSATVTSFTPDLDAASNAPAAPGTDVDLRLNNVCAFRALVTNGVDVAVSQNATAMAHGSVEGAQIDVAANSIALHNTAATINTGLGLTAAPTPISVVVPLDLANATAPGSYSQSDLFTVTVTAN